MRIEETPLSGVMLVKVESHRDERGLFARTFDVAEFEAVGLPTQWTQCNLSWNQRRGTLRGMHFQHEPYSEPKLVRCTKGRVFDVAIDLRQNSRDFGRWYGIELSDDSRDALFIPAGCAHGYLTLEDNCEIFYMVGTVYAPEFAAGVRWNDPAFHVDWPIAPTTMSDRDATWPDFVG
jgi:dTDP-4-dehydrorhamnose 3,5-epimerase